MAAPEIEGNMTLPLSLSQVQDARAAMLIYKKYQKEWEKSIKKLEKLKKKIKSKNKKNSMESDVPAALF